MRNLKIILSGGGTGGHIFPALATAHALKSKNSGIEILFVGAKGKMEMEKIPAAGFNIEGLWISGLQRSLSFQNLLFPFKLMASLIKSMKILRKFKPDAVAGFGGFASGPILYTAARKGIPTLIQEQNSYAGITNKLLGKMVNKICVAYEGMEKFFPAEKIHLSGNPVRQDISELKDKKSIGLEFFGLSPAKKTILVIGGSLGAQSINESIMEQLDTFKNHQLQLIWQTGKSFYKEAKIATGKFEQDGIIAVDFISKMDLAYAAADLVVSRAGAIAVSELCITAKPAVLIPFPYAAEDHQTKNARALVDRKAAVLIHNSEAKEKLMGTVLQLINNEDKLKMLSENIAKQAIPDSAEQIADEILKLILHEEKTKP